MLRMNTLRIVNPEVPLGPYADPATGLLLAFNGEIYNYRQVAAAWGITRDAGESDAHLLLQFGFMVFHRSSPCCWSRWAANAQNAISASLAFRS
jgi:hypothetical protein